MSKFILFFPKLKFADVGYLRNSHKAIELELFMAGKSIKKIAINHLICVDEGCMSKGSFNEQYLVESYPNDLMQNLLLAKPIYNAKNLTYTETGFIQKIVTKDVAISYRVDQKSIFFKDAKNKIIFKFKDIK